MASSLLQPAVTGLVRYVANIPLASQLSYASSRLATKCCSVSETVISDYYEKFGWHIH